MTDKMKSELYKKFSQMNLEEDYFHTYGEKLGLFMAGADALENLIKSQEPENMSRISHRDKDYYAMSHIINGVKIRTVGELRSFLEANKHLNDDMDIILEIGHKHCCVFSQTSSDCEFNANIENKDWSPREIEIDTTLKDLILKTNATGWYMEK